MNPLDQTSSVPTHHLYCPGSAGLQLDEDLGRLHYVLPITARVVYLPDYNPDSDEPTLH